MSYRNRFQRAADDQGFEQPLDESPVDVPERWDGGQVEQTGGFILCRIWRYGPWDEDAEEPYYEAVYGSEPGVSINRYEPSEVYEGHEWAGEQMRRQVDENTDERKAEVAKQMMIEHMLEVGSYWIDASGRVLRLEDIPTDGPLFRDIEEDDETFADVQMEIDEFDPDEFLQVEHERVEGGIDVKFRASGAEHRYEFAIDPKKDSVWPEWLVQGGESYRASLDEMPAFVVSIVEEEYGVKVVER